MAYGNGGSILGGPADARMATMPGDIYIPSNEFKPPPTRTPAAQIEAERLNKAVEVLHLMLNELEGRLRDVLASEGPGNAAKPLDRPESSVALARHLGGLADRVEQATTRVKSLMERIEV